MNPVDDFSFYPFMAAHLAPVCKKLVADYKWHSTHKEPYYGPVIERIPHFYTIGMATYKDGYKDLKPDRVANSNAQLRFYFKSFYDFQLLFFQDLFRTPVTYMKDMPLPGFHYFEYCDEFTQPLARPHVDVPFNKYDWGERVEEGNIFTHVIPIEVPDGAGMYVWDLTAMDMAKRGAEAVVMEARSKEPNAFIEHKENLMCVHSGKYVHMIKPFEKGQDNKKRITLQSHAVHLDGKWQLYW